MPTLSLPTRDGGLEPYTMREPVSFPRAFPPFARVAYAAAHVVADPRADQAPGVETPIDWDATLAYRRHLWSLGLGVAEAMDTAQRGEGLDADGARELIRRSLDASRGFPGAQVACGCGTDPLPAHPETRLDDLIRAYEGQIETVESLGGRVVLMASRALAACAKSPDDYRKVYERLLSQVRQPVIVHWLGEVFDPQLAGYWGHREPEAAMEVCLGLVTEHAARVEGIKLSLLDPALEIAMRSRLPAGVRMYTGDDLHFPELIAGDARGHSDALLGIFDPIAPAAAAALGALSRGDRTFFHRILAPTLPLARHMFEAPSRFYKTGVVFLAFLNGHQDHFVMLGGQQSARSVQHLAELFRRADGAGLLVDPERAAHRMRLVLALHGIGG